MNYIVRILILVISASASLCINSFAENWISCGYVANTGVQIYYDDSTAVRQGETGKVWIKNVYPDGIEIRKHVIVEKNNPKFGVDQVIVLNKDGIIKKNMHYFGDKVKWRYIRSGYEGDIPFNLFWGKSVDPLLKKYIENMHQFYEKIDPEHVFFRHNFLNVKNQEELRKAIQVNNEWIRQLNTEKIPISLETYHALLKSEAQLSLELLLWAQNHFMEFKMRKSPYYIKQMNNICSVNVRRSEYHTFARIS